MGFGIEGLVSGSRGWELSQPFQELEVFLFRTVRVVGFGGGRGGGRGVPRSQETAPPPLELS